MIKVNKNKKLVAEIKQRIKDNNGYCPCRLLKNEDTKCMCKEFRENPEMTECHCGRFIREETTK